MVRRLRLQAHHGALHEVRLPAALGIAVVMLVAILVHRQHGFFMNWLGTQEGEGVEYHLLALGAAVALIVDGAGAWSIDALIAR